MVPNPSLIGNNDTWTLTVTYRDPQNRWKIVPNNSPSPCSVVFSGSAASFINGTAVPMYLFSSARQENEIHRAVNYFYNVQNVFPKYYTPGGTIIRAHSHNQTPWFQYAYINMFNRTSIGIPAIGDILHELGHLVQYENNRNTWVLDKNEFYYESFACYVSWYLGEAYYASLGWTKPSVSSDITTYGQQDWDFSVAPNAGWYSPLFIDLTDNYNQQQAYVVRPNDNISNIPPSVIWNIINTCQTWTQCRPKLQSYVGTYYTATEFSNWIRTFDLWTSINPQN
jgi:hypothetical protein